MHNLIVSSEGSYYQVDGDFLGKVGGLIIKILKSQYLAPVAAFFQLFRAYQIKGHSSM